MHKTHTVVLGSLIGITLFSAAILSSTITSATAENTDIIDQVNVTVPVSCSMEATGMDSHITQLHNNEYNSNVGTTNAKAYCNDVNGFAIYAIGYTDDTDGKNVLTDSNLASTNDITTGVTTSGDYSKWAMKLTTPSSPTPTYPLSIQNNFDSFHTVPDDYTMVAKRTSATDAGSSAIGSTFTTTYQIYIGPTQSAGTYEGQVKYVLVHPNYVDQETMRNAVTVVFDGNGLTFPGGATTNTVKYANLCEPGGYGYVGNTPYATIGTSNLNNDGTQNQNSPYTDNEYVLQTFTLPGADKVKVVVDYGTTSGTAEAIAIEGTWDGDWDNFNADWDNDWIYYDDNASGTVTRIVNGNTVTVFSDSWNTPESGYDYGYYFKVYPVYNTEQPNTTYEELPSSNCSIIPISGTYIEPTGGQGRWLNETSQEIIDKDSLKEMISQDYSYIKGTTINLKAHNPYTIKYDGNGASNSNGMGVHHYWAGRDEGYQVLEVSDGTEIVLLAPNYKRTGYGFIGWSTDANAASHINTATIYGPNETIIADQTLLNTADASKVITLYAVWLPSAGNIQNWSGCSSMNIGNVTALTDTRDSDTYAVAKLADGNCWMMENLRLGDDSSITLTTADTQSAGVLPAADNTIWHSASSLQGRDVPSIATVNTEALNNSVEKMDDNNYAYGTYYSWSAAINNSAEADVFPIEEATTSICPSGWKLPDYSNYRSLIDSTTTQEDSNTDKSNKMRAYPLNYVLSGELHVYSGGNIQDSDSIFAVCPYTGNHRCADYWTSSSRVSSVFAYIFYISDDYVDVGYQPNYNSVSNGAMEDGLSMRCVLSTP